MIGVQRTSGSLEGLAMIGSVLVGACIAGAVLCRRLAPGVSLGLAGGLLAGVLGFFVSSADGPKLVPAEVVIWASCGLGAFGLIGLLVLPGHPPAAPLRHAAVAVALAAPFVAVALGSLLVEACPLYVTRGAGYCFYDFDMLGGWAAGVAIGLDLLSIAFLLGVSAWQARKTGTSCRAPEQILAGARIAGAQSTTSAATPTTAATAPADQPAGWVRGTAPRPGRARRCSPAPPRT